MVNIHLKLNVNLFYCEEETEAFVVSDSIK